MGSTNLTVVGFPILQALQSIVKSSYIKGLFYTVISYFSSTLNEINKSVCHLQSVSNDMSRF